MSVSYNFIVAPLPIGSSVDRFSEAACRKRKLIVYLQSRPTEIRTTWTLFGDFDGVLGLTLSDFEIALTAIRISIGSTNWGEYERTDSRALCKGENIMICKEKYVF